MTDSPVFYMDAEDPEMRAANEAARRSFGFFWRELAWERRRIVPGLELAAIKVPFCDDPGGEGPVEQMWCNEVDFDGHTIEARLLNAPHRLTRVAQGDPVLLELSGITDWMYAMSGRVYGAYTVNLMRQSMSPGERRGHDSAWGLDFGDANVIELVPAQYLGKVPGVVGRPLGKKPPEGNPADHEHPMAVNMAPKLAEALQQTPALLTEADERGFTLLHELALAGDASGVKVLLSGGAARDARTKRGLTPRDLAAVFDWTRVIALLDAHASN